MPQLEDQSALARHLRDAEQLSTQTPSTPQPQLSVILPAHDVGPWIRETLESLQGQTFTDFELIVVDDHSEDETSEILREFANTDPRIRVVAPDGRGGAHARNVGVRLARGRYLAFCDGDDIVPEGAYQALMDATDGSDPDIVFGDFIKFSPRRTWRPSQPWRVFDEPRAGLQLSDEPGLVRHRACWNKVFRADFWREHDIVFPEVPRSNDIVPMLEAYVQATNIAITPAVVYIYRDRPGASSMSSRASGTRSLVSYIEQELICEQILLTRGTPEARQRHAWMIANADGWVHLKKYLASIGPDDAVEPEVIDLIHRLVALIGDGQIPPASEIERRLVLALCEVHDIASAALAVRVFEQEPLADGTAWFDDWVRVLRAIPAGSRFTSAEEVAGRWILRRLRDAVHITDAEVPAAGLRAVLDELRPDALSTVGSLSMLDVRLNRSLTALRDGDEAAFASRLAPVRQTHALVETVRRAGQGVEITGSFSARQSITLTALASIGPDRSTHEIASLASSTEGPQTWSATVRADRIAPGRKQSLVLVGRSESGQDVIVVPHGAAALRKGGSVSTDTIEVSAGTSGKSTVTIRLVGPPAQPRPTPGWRSALRQVLPTRRR